VENRRVRGGCIVQRQALYLGELNEGACWLAMHLWEMLGLDRFWEPLLRPNRKGTRWLSVLKALVACRLIDPGSEFRFHRERLLSEALPRKTP
jgi:hypothetical protein